MEKKDMLGLYIGIGDVFENEKRIGECIFNLELVMMPSGKIEGEGVILEVTDGEINYQGKEAEFKISGILSRDHTTYTTEFKCRISPKTYPKFIVEDSEEIFRNLKPNP
ncbi:MAG: hypothetical protein QXW78_02950 [Candidatus Thermoplasmatota archaeon]